MHESRSLIERQLAAYNARDIDLWLTTYAPQAEQVLADGTLLARGREQRDQRMRRRFADPHLHAALIHRIVIDRTVIDHERVTRTGPAGSRPSRWCACIRFGG
jgi:putative hydrolase of HD superfamily